MNEPNLPPETASATPELIERIVDDLKAGGEKNKAAERFEELHPREIADVLAFFCCNIRDHHLLIEIIITY